MNSIFSKKIYFIVFSLLAFVFILIPTPTKAQVTSQDFCRLRVWLATIHADTYCISVKELQTKSETYKVMNAADVCFDFAKQIEKQKEQSWFDLWNIAWVASGRYETDCTVALSKSDCQDEKIISNCKNNTNADILIREGTVKNPTPTINIPGLELSDIKTTISDGDYIIPWIGQYISALYSFALVAFSILGVIMLIFEGVKIMVSAGGEGKQQGIKRAGQIMTGLALAWLSYSILYTINPELIRFKSLSIKFLPPKDIEDSVNYKTADRDEKVDDKTISSWTVPTKTELDGLFKAYAACYGMDWRLLKGIAAVESDLNPKAQRPGSKYAGLFQVSPGYCTWGMSKGKYPKSLGLSCSDRIHPETNTAVASAIINYQLKSILKKCPSSSAEDTILLLYVGHNNGSGVLKEVLKMGGCRGDDIRLKVRKFYDDRGGKYLGIDTDWGERKYKVGKKVFKAAKSYGLKEIYPTGAKDTSLCPKDTGKKALAK